MKKWSNIALIGALIFNITTAPALAASKKNTKEYTSYTVKRGDTLYKVASKYHTSVSSLKNDNHLKSEHLKVNQKLLIKQQKSEKIASLKKPVLQQLVNITNNNVNSYVVKGSAESNSTIYLTFKDSKNKILTTNSTSDNKGNFVTNVYLKDLANGFITITSFQKTNNGQQSPLLTNIVHKYTSLPKEVVDKNTFEINKDVQLKYHIYNNKSHAYDTTKGLNDALKFAKEQGFKTVKVPAGTYLISKGEGIDYINNKINMLSDITLELDKNAVFQKETNGLEEYSVIYFGPGVENSTIKGGTLRGDRDTHDYSHKEGPWSAGTHEWGYGVNIAGGRNITVDGMFIQKFTGDGISIGGSTAAGSYDISENDLEVGSIDAEGNLIPADGKIRTKAFKDFSKVTSKTTRVVNIWLPEGLTNKDFEVFYYKTDGSFLSKDTGRVYSNYSIAPDDAASYKIVFNAPKIEGVKMTMMAIENAKGVLIKNNDIGYNRRQGITAGGENVQILNNKIHHTGGTAPQSGIDIEPGFFPAINHVIKGNTFLDNKIQIVACYGENLTVDGNYFEQTSAVHGGVGVSIKDVYRGKVSVNNNTFKGSGLIIWTPNATADNNHFTNGSASMSGNNQLFSNATFYNSQFSIGSYKNQSASNLEFTQNGEVGNDQSSLYIWDNPSTLKNVTIHADQTGKRIPGIIQGYGNSNSVYENLTVIDKAQRGSVLVAGTYNNAKFDAGNLGINREGKYVFNNSSFKSNSSILRVDKLYGEAPDVSFNKSLFIMTGNTGYGASIYVQGAKNFNMIDSILHFDNNTVTYAPLIKFGPYGYPKDTNILGVTMKGNTIYTKKGVNVSTIDTTNAGIDAPSYDFENNIIYNGKLSLKSNDINLNNTILNK
jgi:LysM repeat protein